MCSEPEIQCAMHLRDFKQWPNEPHFELVLSAVFEKLGATAQRCGSGLRKGPAAVTQSASPCSPSPGRAAPAERAPGRPCCQSPTHPPFLAFVDELLFIRACTKLPPLFRRPRYSQSRRPKHGRAQSPGGAPAAPARRSEQHGAGAATPHPRPGPVLDSSCPRHRDGDGSAKLRARG